MDALRGLAPRGPLDPRRLLLAVLAVTAILVGLLAMHTLSGGGQAAHEAGIAQAAAHDAHAAPAAAAAHGDRAEHTSPAAAPAEPAGLLAALDCSDDDCERLAAMAAGCVLALLALALVVRSSVAAALLGFPRGVLAELAPPWRPVPALTLVELSISRT